MTIAYLNVATDRQHLDIQREEISSFAAAKDIHVDKWRGSIIVPPCMSSPTSC